MRLQIVSDLHLEFGPVNSAAPVVDVAVLPGDIGVGTYGLDWIREHFKNCPVIYVLGNHEFYHHSIPELTAKIQTEADGTNIHLLENSAVELRGFTFLGCTLWTDFALRGNHASVLRAKRAYECKSMVDCGMRNFVDYGRIRTFQLRKSRGSLTSCTTR